MPTFDELFAGGGLVRQGLGHGWDCLYANDVCPEKARTYRANHGGAAELHVGDIRDVAAADIPKADLLTATFPCQDHSIAGPQGGFAEGERGLLVFTVMHLIVQCAALGTAPGMVLLENVFGLLQADGGADLERLLTALVSAGYTVGVLAIDAVLFLPHSRPRVFIVAVRSGMPIPAGLVSRRPLGPWYPKRLVRVLGAMPNAVARKLVWWKLPVPPKRTRDLVDLVEPFGSATEKWRLPENVAELVATCRPDDAARLEEARGAGRPVYGTVGFKRWDRSKNNGRALMVRTDGITPCLLGKADLHYQQLLRVDGDDVRVRPFTRREFGRVMGVPDAYVMPPSVARSARLAGEGVAVPVVRWLAAHLLEPLAVAAAAEQVPARTPPRRRPERVRKDAVAIEEAVGGKLKEKTVGTTVYLSPEESARAHAMAADMGCSLHELLLMGLDRMYMQRSMPPIRRAHAARR